MPAPERRFRMSALAYRRVTFAAVVLLAIIVVTGAAVRLTGSGLGCPKWPTCDQALVRVGPSDVHKSIESANRTITGLVSVVVILAVLGSLFRVTRRKDLTLLSLGLVLGVIGQIVLGGLVVLTDLNPYLVMQHFTVSMLLVLDAVVLHHRAGWPDGPEGRPAEGRPAVGPDTSGMARVALALTAMVIILGTVVTGSGPHSGSNGEEIVKRLPYTVSSVARLHGIGVMLLLGTVVWLAWTTRRHESPAVRRAVEIVLVAIVAQAAVGYTQYFTGVPVGLVGIHVALATGLWIAVIRLNLAMRTPLAPAHDDADAPAVSEALVG